MENQSNPKLRNAKKRLDEESFESLPSGVLLQVRNETLQEREVSSYCSDTHVTAASKAPPYYNEIETAFSKYDLQRTRISKTHEPVGLNKSSAAWPWANPTA